MPSLSFLRAVNYCNTRNDNSHPESYILGRLKVILKIDPYVVQETDDSGFTLLHHAAQT